MRTRSGGVLAVGCLTLCGRAGGSDGDPPLLTADVPPHLETHLERASVEGSTVSGVPESLEWSFAEPQPEWRPMELLPGRGEPAPARAIDDALRLSLGPGNRAFAGRLPGGIYVDLGERSLLDWGHVEVRARTSDPMYRIGLELNYTETDPASTVPLSPTASR